LFSYSVGLPQTRLDGARRRLTRIRWQPLDIVRSRPLPEKPRTAMLATRAATSIITSGYALFLRFEITMLAHMDCYGLSDKGCRRPNNQDHFLIADLNKSMRVHGTSLNLDQDARIYGGSQGKLLVVADGMGGEAEGERASTIAVDQVTTYVLNSLAWCFRLEDNSEQDFSEHLKEALISCQESIHAVALRHPEMHTMGTTMTMVYILWPRAFVVHVGDSRCYLLRNGQLDQITTDHTMGHVLAKVGQLNRNEARRTSLGHALWNVLGGRSQELSVDVDRLTLQRDDTLLLCTDGLYDMVADDQLAVILNSSRSAEAACRQLVELANENGGKDNITLIVARFLAPQDDEPRAFVEAEVPLEQLTAPPDDDTTKTTVNMRAS
jgi:protein phosphatase